METIKKRHRKTQVVVLLYILILMWMIMKYRPGNISYGKPVLVKKVPDEKEIFQFDFSDIKNCKDMYKGNGDRKTQFSEIHKSMAMLNKEAFKYTRSMTGNVGMKPIQALFFLTVANASFINTICETGFNAGHSSYLWLTGNTKAQVYTFDRCDQKYTKPMIEYLNKSFSGRLHATCGDSKKTIPEFTKNNPEVICDLIFVDGGHDYASGKADLRNLQVHANRNYHVIIGDDFTFPGIKKAWTEGLEAGHLKEHFHCVTSGKIKLSMIVGKYTFTNSSNLYR